MKDYMIDEVLALIQARAIAAKAADKVDESQHFAEAASILEAGIDGDQEKLASFWTGYQQYDTRIKKMNIWDQPEWPKVGQWCSFKGYFGKCVSLEVFEDTELALLTMKVSGRVKRE